MKKPSSKIREEIARLQEQLKQAETREAERIGRLALKAGLGDIEIKRIYLLSKFHGSGAGRALFEAALEEARAGGRTRLLLGVYKQNAKALGFYERMGFTRVGEREFDVGGAVYEDWVLGRALG